MTSWRNAMRILAPVIVIASLLLALAASGFHPFRKAPAARAPLGEFTAHLDGRIAALMRLYRIPGCSVALVQDNALVWSSAYGYADVQSKRALTTDTPMRVQSISKSVTAWGVMKLAARGKLDLGAPVAQSLKSWQFPAFGIPTEGITARQLLSHTAGLPLGDVFTIYAPGDAMPSLAEKLTREAVPFREPGQAFSYSNTGYNLLELLIEDITGQPFAAYMEQEILKPLGMGRSSFVWSEAMDPPVPVGYDFSGKPVPVYVYPEKASGGLFATAEDIAAFAAAGMKGVSNQALDPAAVAALHTPVVDQIGIYGLVFDGYGLGHYAETLPNGSRAISHGGQGTGIMTHFHAVPETGDAIVILTNSQRSWPFISCLLNDWAQWRGFGAVGMGRIIWGEYGLWAVAGLISSGVLLQALRLAIWAARARRKAPQGQKRPVFGRAVQAGAGLAILGGLIFCLCQKYLFVSSVFPRASVGLGIAALGLAAVLLLSALFPRKWE